jgi:hypothetical protein
MLKIHLIFFQLELLLFFLLLAQKKETKKRAAKNNCSAVFGKPAHMTTYSVCGHIMLSNLWDEHLASCCSKSLGALSFSFGL